MALTRLSITAMVLGLLAAGGCNEQKLKDEVALLQNENTELRGQLTERDTALETANDELRRANREFRDAQALFDEERETWTTTSTGSFDDIEGVSATYGDGSVTVSVEGDVLFASGKTSLRSPAKTALQKVASVLKREYAGKQIYIAGHTDSDPIRKSGHKSNHHLGFERGYAVRDFLSSNGISSEDMAIISFGPDQPKSNASKSRRVEIVVAN